MQPIFKTQGETDMDYMYRYVGIPHIEDIAGVFCSYVVHDKFFKTILSQLNTLKICNSYEKKLSDFVFETHNHLIISAFIIESLKKKEFYRILTMKIPLGIFDNPPEGEEEAYSFANQQVKIIREKQLCKVKLDEIIGNIPFNSLKDLNDICISNKEPTLEQSLKWDNRKLHKWIEINLQERGKKFKGFPTVYKMRFILGNEEYFTFTHNENHFISNKHKIIEIDLCLLKLIPGILNGNCFEVYQDNFSIKKEDHFWNDWEISVKKARQQYKKVYHPIILKVALHVLNKIQAPAILEVGGGTGRLAKKIINHYPHENNYTLLEMNDCSIEKAKKRLGNKVSIVKTDIVDDLNYYQDSNKTVPIIEKSIDIVLASGVLTTVVLENKTEALKVLNKIHRYLKSGGYLIMAGHAASLLASEDFDGFNIINTGLPYLPVSFYIIKKR